MLNNASQLINRAQAAAQLGVALRTIDELISNGSLKVVRIGRAVRFRPSALEEFIEANESQVPPARRRRGNTKTSTSRK